ncbi:hypothetical protein EJ05DRAFT_480626 [Pseudovirgaria hyperparasitica]|uniref:Acyltransferase MbtK/IucB-like conserved domain-containing protein n=1 Tax=Pseudovirgaria hyperparasitica TaxID=470096 RepID=A0A6A6VV14_9PEZI|nr:uncharacterized protein EJ05DRAFT_480626 [Pseudovirgaria hyperparasitica]KAF2753107.1 hypothetical protein EJ05DRAFT_480626 [Pseudovirgaria hyperparasitica]
MATTNSTSPSPKDFILKLPHPYLTAYGIKEKSISGKLHCFLDRIRSPKSSLRTAQEPPEILHNVDLYFTLPEIPSEQDQPPESNNLWWARAQRSPSVTLTWQNSAPSPAQVWLVIYALYSLHTDIEHFRLNLTGGGSDTIRDHLLNTLLATSHPSPTDSATPALDLPILVLRSTFWQGASSPFGPRPLWLPEPNAPGSPVKPLSQYPLPPLSHRLTTGFPSSRVHAHHPIRPAKPAPGTTVYSRFIPHLGEHFSMVALDHTLPAHLELFHKWQNDPRVARGWNETGTLDQHRKYLQTLHDDPHVLTLLAAFDDVLFAYFEVYWAPEDHIGVHHAFPPYARGRHSLVGDVRFRGPHRVCAWWGSLMHYLFLDDPRTGQIVGEPKATNKTVLEYDFAHGFSLVKWMDLGHKRSALMWCERERFFQLSPFGWNGSVLGPDGLNALVTSAKL